jgi:hypothetical protein
MSQPHLDAFANFPTNATTTDQATVGLSSDLKCLLASGISAGELTKLSVKADRLLTEEKVKKLSIDPSCRTTWVASDSQLTPCTCCHMQREKISLRPGCRARSICAHIIAAARMYGEIEFCVKSTLKLTRCHSQHWLTLACRNGLGRKRPHIRERGQNYLIHSLSTGLVQLIHPALTPLQLSQFHFQCKLIYILAMMRGVIISPYTG